MDVGYPGRRQAAALVALLAAVNFGPPAAVTGAAGAAGTSAPAVHAGVALLDKGAVGDVWCGGRVVIRSRAPAGGFSVEERAAIIGARLAEALAAGAPQDVGASVEVGVVGAQPVVAVGGRLLATPDAESAARQGLTRVELAVAWANQVRACLGAPPVPTVGAVPASLSAQAMSGLASWYGPGFEGRTTASGERFSSREWTAAHRTLPFGTRLVVHYPRTGRMILVRVNDRGPWIPGRILDLSAAAAAALGLLPHGVDRVVIHVVPE